MKIILLTNILSPYRSFFYDEMHKYLSSTGSEFYVLLMARTEPERHWNYEEYKTDYTELLPGHTIAIGNIPIHLNTGLKRIYSKIKPDIVIASGSYLYPAVTETKRLKKHFGYRTYYWSESHLNESRNYGSLRLKLREYIRSMVIPGFDGYWYAGEFSKRFIEKYAGKSGNYIFVPNLIDIAKFGDINKMPETRKKELKSLYGIPDDKLIYLISARLSAVKGIMEFFKIYSNVEKRDNAVILIAGDGELHDCIQNFITQNKINAFLLGYKSEKEMCELYGITDMLILPSLSDPNPLSVIEACWCSLPLLVSNHVGNYPETVRAGENGFVMDYSNPDEISRIISECLVKPQDWYREAGKISYNIAKEIYNPDVAVPRICDSLITE